MSKKLRVWNNDKEQASATHNGFSQIRGRVNETLHKGPYIIFCLHGVQEKAKLTYDARGQKRGYFCGRINWHQGALGYWKCSLP